jgi:Ser/Thr protein kinase RdoA (MazF antagonist)
MRAAGRGSARRRSRLTLAPETGAAIGCLECAMLLSRCRSTTKVNTTAAIFGGPRVIVVGAVVCCSGLVDAMDIARRFALGQPARLSDAPVARGKQGLVWRLDTADGRWAVKMPFRRSSEDEVRLATAFQEAACAAGIPAPQVRRTTEGCVFAAIEGSQVRVYEWVDLRAPDVSLDPGLVGAVVAAIHRISVIGPSPLDPWYHEPVGAGRWDRLIGQLAAAGAPFAGRLAGLRDELVALESWIEPPQMLQTCHRDLWADNVLPTSGGGVCVIDWENSGPADPSQELACVLFEYARADPGRARALADAYHHAGGPAAVNRRGHFSMLIAQLGHITELAATDWLTPNPRSPQRADSAAWIGEVLDEPHTRDLLETILVSVREGARLPQQRRQGHGADRSRPGLPGSRYTPSLAVFFHRPPRFRRAGDDTQFGA